MNRRSSLQLRDRGLPDIENKRNDGDRGNVKKKNQPNYERDRKRRQRSLDKGIGTPPKKGRKESVGIKTMTTSEIKKYERERKAIYRARKKLTVSNSSAEELLDSTDLDTVDHNAENTNTAASILNIIYKSPRKMSKRLLEESCKEQVKPYSFEQLLDIFVMLAPQLPSDVREHLNEKGIQIKDLPKSQKRYSFSSIPKTNKHYRKDALLSTFKSYSNEVVSFVFSKLLLQLVEDLPESLDILAASCGIVINPTVLPARVRLSNVFTEEGPGLMQLGNTTPDFKAVKAAAMAKVKQLSTLSEKDRGAVHVIASTFGVSEKFAKRVLSSNETSPVDLIARSKRETAEDTEWPDKVRSFCLTKPICREAPGESVSIAYGKRAEKYIRQFTIKEIFRFFILKHPNFPYQLSTFHTFVPKNLVAPSLRDIKRNTCPIHENVQRSTKAFNRFLKKNKAKDTCIPASTLDICLEYICNPHPESPDLNRNPLNWSIECTKGNCEKCGVNPWLESLEGKMIERKVDGMDITYSQWVREEDGNDKKGNKKFKVVLRQMKCNIITFIKDVFFRSLSTENFADHLRKSWIQWQITKKPLAVVGDGENDVVIRTREDYQEDIKFLCTSETVSTHRGHGVIMMLCYPVVLEIFKKNGEAELHGLVFLSNTKSKNFETVMYLEKKVVDYVKSMGYTVVRYDRLTDGCSSQFWCWGSCQYLENMPKNLDISVVNFHRYERYEGKNFSDALGSLVKRRMRTAALQNRVHGNDVADFENILNEAEDECEFEDLVFDSHIQAFNWIKMCMSKSQEDRFSQQFKQIKLFWVPDEEIPKNVLIKNECRRIPKIKSFNTATALKQNLGVYVRDTTCSNCENCSQGNMLDCTSKVNGDWQHHVISVKERKTSNQRRHAIENSDEIIESDIEVEEFIYEEASSSDESDEDDVGFEDATQGEFVLYRFTENKYYVAVVVENTVNHVVLSCARKLGVQRNSVTFVWPSKEDHVVVDVETFAGSDFKKLTFPTFGQRGSISFDMQTFGKVPLSRIQ